MSDRPNIILLVGEDAGRALGCYGDPDARTPNLDRLASEGCRYDNAFSTAPVCAPSRSALITGQYAWTIGSQHMRSRLVNPQRVFTQDLRDAGYHVNWHTKLDFNFTPQDGWRDDHDDWLDDLRRDRLPTGKPFFLFRNFGVTHESTMWPEPWDGGGAVKQRLETEHRLTPEQRQDPAGVRVPAYLPDTPEVRANIARFYEAQAIADLQIGEVLDVVNQSKHRDNTLVLYLTDHGRGLIREKRWCYGAGIHLSLIARWPGHIAPGSVSQELVSWVDLAPTFLSLAGAAIPKRLQGQVFLGPDKAPPRKFVFAGRDRMDECYDKVRVARDRDFHYIRNDQPHLPWAQRIRYMDHMETTQVVRNRAADGTLRGTQAAWMGQTKPAEELFFARADPDMVHNLAGDPEYFPALQRLRAALKANTERFGDLAEKSERQLVEEGVLDDMVYTDYAQRISPLPDHQQPAIYGSVLERPD